MNLEKVGEILEKAFKEAIEEKRYAYGLPVRTGIGDKVASGDLLKSLNVVSGEDFIGLEMNFYSQFQQKGRAVGLKGVPIAALLKFINDRGIRPRGKQTKRGLAFAIQTNIKKYGFRSSSFYDVAIDKLFENDELTDALEGVTIEDLINQIEGL